MEIGIIGLPRAGKTTLFNGLTKGNAAVAGYSDKPNIGVAKVPDERLENLATMYNPERVVPAEILYTDLPPPPEGFGETRGISGEYLNALQTVDALLVVVRAFEQSSVSHIDSTVNPARDADNMLMELIFADLEILGRRLTLIEDSFKGTKPQERESLIREQDLLNRIKESLDDSVPLKDQLLQPDEMASLSGFGFLSIKPVILVVNVDEHQLKEKEILGNEFYDAVSSKQVRTAVICAELEMGLAQMTPQEEKEFREGLGAGESSLSQIVRLSYNLVDQISFFTVGEDEVRAWEIKRKTVAQEAAGKIHSDLERGFIRAEVISHKNLLECGGLQQARKLGLLRQEGKEYILQDGDIMHVLFNI